MPNLEASGFDEDDLGNLLDGQEASYSAVHTPGMLPLTKKFPNKCGRGAFPPHFFLFLIHKEFNTCLKEL